MNRRDSFLDIVSGFSESNEIAIKYAEHLEELFDVIIPEKIGDEFCKSLEDSDYAAAIKACAKYFRSKPDLTVPELSGKGEYDIDEAEKCVNGVVSVVNIEWTFADGEIDFLFNPTETEGPLNHEWLWQLNRHYYWVNMARAYNDTKDERYAKAFGAQLLKWIAQTYIKEKWNAPGSAWRTIECGIRLLGSWPVSYDGFRRSSSVSDVTLLLMIASMHRQTVHLIEHPTGKNWLMMESNGAYTFSALFTELSDSEINRQTAAKRLLCELEAQILPDGMHYELSPDYHSVIVSCALNFYGLAMNLGFADEIPESFVTLMHKTVNAAVLLSTPALVQPRTNDTFTIATDTFTRRAEELLGSTPGYRFINSRRAEGEPPCKKNASVFLPYAGFAIMRSDWGADAAYLCFDVGPLGMAHVHQDKLNVNIYKGSRELIYDDGGGQYEISRFREYAKSGYGHNTVLVDGLAQYRQSPSLTDEPIDAGWVTNEAFDYAASTYSDTFGKEMIKSAVHKREVRFCKPSFFIVSDTLTSIDGNEHDYEVLFHLDTTGVKKLTEYKNGVISDFGKDYEVVMIPLDESAVSVELNVCSAVTEPYVQGWYNGRNESNLHEAVTVSRKVRGVKDCKFNTLIFPVKTGDAVPKVIKSQNGQVHVCFEGKNYSIDFNSLNK